MHWQTFKRQKRMRRYPGWPLVILIMAAILIVPPAGAGNPPKSQLDSSLLFAFIQKEDRQSPLVAFGQADSGIDEVLSRENRTFLGGNQALLERIRTQLASETLQWQLEEASTRRMIVPEHRPAYAALFENYCQAAVDYVLQKTRLPNPYRSIATFEDEDGWREAATGEKGGITALLVHNIADVYTEAYVFSDAADGGPKVRIKLSNRSFTGEVGSYSSWLIVGEDKQYEFVRNPYTLWRNSADDPLNVLIAPIEETLHIALRQATEEAIKQRLVSQPPPPPNMVERIVEEWLAVEEAAVGGLVRQLMPEIMDRFLVAWPRRDIDATLAARRQFDKYRYIDAGIRIVETLGLETFINLYQQDPQAFRAMLDAAPIDDAPPSPKASDQRPVAKPAA